MKITPLITVLLLCGLTSTLAFSNHSGVGIRRIASDPETNYFENCNNPNAGGTTLPFSGTIDKPIFRPECAPDTLYHWVIDLDWDKFQNDVLGGQSYLYTWRTPFSTFGYGDQQIRIKLRKDIRFRWIDEDSRDCRKFSAEEAESTVFVSWVTYINANMVDYLICSGKVADSWSTQTKGAALEAQNEFAYAKAHVSLTTQNYDAYIFGKNRTRLTPDYYKGNLYFADIDDDLHPGISWTDHSLGFNLEVMNEKYSGYPAEVSYAPGVEHSLSEHLFTVVPSIFRMSDKQFQSAVIERIK